MRRTLVIFSAIALASIASPAEAQQQALTQFNVDRFNPSERGSEWFALDTLDMRGNVRPAIGVVGEWADKPLVLSNPSSPAVVSSQLFLHPGASIVVLDSLRFGFDLPVAVIDQGNTVTSGTTGQVFAAPTDVALGDFRIGADLRLVGRYASPFTMAVGGQFFMPSGEAKQYTGDDLAHGILHVQAAGEAGVLAYSVKLGFHVRAQPSQTTIDGHPYGDALVYGAALGLRLADRHLLIGPEIYGETNTGASGGFFASGSTPVEALLGLHATLGDDWRIGAGAGPGITRDLGSPLVRVLLSAEWTPGYHPPPPEPVAPPDRDGDKIPDAQDACPDQPGPATDDPKTNGCPPPGDKDGDGIPDPQDACPDKPGVKTDDPKTNGCPPDKDGDGIVDSEDACPDKPGVKTDDPKTNGCPPDKDGDGIPDAEDACPDKPGVKTEDPKTNGCPADRDGDGIVDDDDACPDAPGPKTDDPKTNGCPKAAVVGGQIKITEQVKFATGSAKILADSDELLGAVTDVINKHPEITKIRIEGHTDNVGKPAMNKKLSQARADSVKAWLVKHGIKTDRLTTQGFGQEKPIDTNTTDQGRANNRRVEFHIEQQTPPAGATP
ncbi:MAG TPA: OmpA family protein [Polyangiaceae bacterium]|nr:OmpA family protein [Polyangiaceae bacterium]